MQVGAKLPRRLTIVGVSLLSLVACCGLAWWQWERFSSANGTFQNLGYVLQWPLFGLFPAFMFWRMRKLRGQTQEQDTEQADEPADEPVSSARTAATAAVPVSGAVDSGYADDEYPDDGYPDDEQDAELAEYNRYLAELNRIDATPDTRRSR